MKQEKNPTALETLLGLTPPDTRTALVHMRQLSESAGQEVLFAIRALGYDRVCEIRQQESFDNGHFAEAVILAGVTQPNLRDPQLLHRFGGATPYEMLHRLLSAGEIAELSFRIEQLSGYRMQTTELIDAAKKK